MNYDSYSVTPNPGFTGPASICCDLSGTIIATANNGVWVSAKNSGLAFLQNNSTTNFRSICCSSDGSKMASCKLLGNIWTSSDYGLTWTENITTGVAKNWYSICCSSDGSKVFTCVSGGNIWTSSNTGSTWTQNTTTGVAKSWYTMCCSSDGTKVFAGVTNGNIWTSSNSGSTWTENTTTGAGKNWYSLCCSSNGTNVFACVRGGNIWTSSNSGSTWAENTTTGAGKAWISICCSSDGTKLAASVYSGNIWTSSNSGSTWTENTTNGLWTYICCNYDLSKFFCVDSNGNKVFSFFLKGYTYNSYNLNYILSPPVGSDTSNNVLTNITINNGLALKYLKPFYTGTTDESTFNTNYRMYSNVGYSYNNNNKFCPNYILYPGNENLNNSFTRGTVATWTNVSPPTGATNMLAILVGAGGGGGGGQSNGGSGQGGDGGGGGGISVYYLPASTYTISVGYGGIYGYRPGNSGGGPGDPVSSGANNAGVAGETGYFTRITVGGINYDASGGYGGDGGAQNVNLNTGAVIMTTGIYNYAGNNGTAGTTGSNNPNPGGNGGTPKYSNIINSSFINLVSLQHSLTAENVPISTLLLYGQGGKGGRGDKNVSNDWGANGEFGAPGCAIMFFYYN